MVKSIVRHGLNPVRKKERVSKRVICNCRIMSAGTCVKGELTV